MQESEERDISPIDRWKFLNSSIATSFIEISNSSIATNLFSKCILSNGRNRRKEKSFRSIDENFLFLDRDNSFLEMQESKKRDIFEYLREISRRSDYKIPKKGYNIIR